MAVKTVGQFLRALKQHGSLRGIAEAENQSFHSVRQLYLQALEQDKIEPLSQGQPGRSRAKKAAGNLRAKKPAAFPVKAKRFIFTSAQNNTKLHTPFWNNLLAYADHIGAAVVVSRFTYIKAGLGARGDKTSFVKRGDALGNGEAWWKGLTWDERLRGHCLDDRYQIAPGLVWCGEVNISPTAARPLSGFESYTHQDSAIFPHPKVALETIPTAKYDPPKFTVTTGAVTLRNYIQRKAGLKAEHHHVYGALLVEIDREGGWHTRHINATNDGSFYDLDCKVANGEVTPGNRVEAVIWGDIHRSCIDETVYKTSWQGKNSILDTLQPKYQVFHDILDFSTRSHHGIQDPYVRYANYVAEKENVRAEVEQVAGFLEETTRPWCTSLVVDSNHNNHIGRWLREQDGRKDPVNAEFWLELQLSIYRKIRQLKDVAVHYLHEALDAVGYERPDNVKLLGEDEQFLIKGVVVSNHGHNGPNGSRGNPKSFAKMGYKSITGHTHAKFICDGAYVVGASCELHRPWNKGPSSWSHTHGIIYPNGKRTLFTIKNGRWRA